MRTLSAEEMREVVGGPIIQNGSEIATSTVPPAPHGRSASQESLRRKRLSRPGCTRIE
jgi:hypothetical protein